MTKKKVLLQIFLVFFIIVNINPLFPQEWSSLRLYKKKTGNTVLIDGCWLKKDRKKKTEVWKKANLYNLGLENGNKKYKRIREIRDFYAWFDKEIKKQGHEMKWIGIASIVAGQLSKLDNFFIRVFIVRNKELIRFANEGSKKVFEFAFPKLKKIYFFDLIVKGKIAEEWDMEFGQDEQCLILEPIYKKLSKRALRKLEKIAKGKGVYRFGVPKKIRFDGDIKDCKTRFEHGVNKLIPYYLDKLKK